MRKIHILLLMMIIVTGTGIVSADDGLFSVVKSHDLTTVNPGDTFTYTIAYTNTADYSFFEPFCFDTLPEEVEFISCNGCNSEGAPHIEWEGISQFEVEPGQTISNTITVKLKPGTEGKTFCNQASVGGGAPEINPLNGQFYGPPSGTTTVTDCITVPGGPIVTPEFPTMILPVTLLAGFILTVVFIRQTRQ